MNHRDTTLNNQLKDNAGLAADNQSAIPRPTNSAPQRIIGLTGGIGMGKSTVSKYLAEHHHISVVDADVLARDAVAEGSSILGAIAQRYGQAILHPNGTLDRARLAHIVFQRSSERLWLDQQIHPYVRRQIETALSHPDYLNQPTIVLAIPLLFEARMTDLTTEIWVVWCELEQQIERVMQRSVALSGQTDGSPPPLSREQVMARIQAQMDIQRKIRQADVVLDNSCSLDELYVAIDQALKIGVSVQSE